MRPASITDKRIQELLTPMEYKEFNEWMVSQTVPSEHSVYTHDFERWLE